MEGIETRSWFILCFGETNVSRCPDMEGIETMIARIQEIFFLCQ